MTILTVSPTSAYPPIAAAMAAAAPGEGSFLEPGCCNDSATATHADAAWHCSYQLSVQSIWRLDADRQQELESIFPGLSEDSGFARSDTVGVALMPHEERVLLPAYLQATH